MKRLAILVLLGACSWGPETAVRTSVPPPGPSQDRQKLERPERRATDEAATDEFLRAEAERARRPDPPPPPPQQPAVRYEQVPLAEQYYAYPDSGPRLPWGTAFGAGVGAIIGNQSGHSGEGAAIGASIGLMLDIASWY